MQNKYQATKQKRQQAYCFAVVLLVYAEKEIFLEFSRIQNFSTEFPEKPLHGQGYISDCNRYRRACTISRG